MRFYKFNRLVGDNKFSVRCFVVNIIFFFDLNIIIILVCFLCFIKKMGCILISYNNEKLLKRFLGYSLNIF